MLGLVAKRLGLEGVAFRPSWYHMAHAVRRHFQFVDPERQGEFEALMAALKDVPLREATVSVAEGRVRRDGDPYQWQADDMVLAFQRAAPAAERVAAARSAHAFTLG